MYSLHVLVVVEEGEEGEGPAHRSVQVLVHLLGDADGPDRIGAEEERVPELGDASPLFQTLTCVSPG